MPSPTTNRRSKPLRCSYREDERQCRRNGVGNPPLCAAHELVVQQAGASPLRDVVDRIRTGQRVSSEDLIGAVTELAFGIFAPGIGPDDVMRARQAAEQARRAAQARVAAEQMRRARVRVDADPPPTSAKPDPNGRDPRVVAARRALGFDNLYLHLTADEVKAKRRELARKYHPDHARDDRDRAFRTQQMAHINAAADLLLEGFG